MKEPSEESWILHDKWSDLGREIAELNTLFLKAILGDEEALIQFRVQSLAKWNKFRKLRDETNDHMEEMFDDDDN